GLQARRHHRLRRRRVAQGGHLLRHRRLRHDVRARSRLGHHGRAQRDRRAADVRARRRGPGRLLARILLRPRPTVAWLGYASTLTRIELVAPETPMGAPNTQTILSPGEPSPFASTNALARSTMASAS